MASGSPGCTSAGASDDALAAGYGRTRMPGHAARSAPSPSTQISRSEVRARSAACKRSTKASSTTSSFASLLARKYSICGPIDAVLIGTVEAPSQPQPRNTSRNSMRLPLITATRSPRCTSASASAAARRPAACTASRCVHDRPAMRSIGRSPNSAACRCSIAGSVRSPGGSGLAAPSSVVIGASAKVGGLHARIAGQFLRNARERDFAGFQDVAVVGGLQRGARVLLH
jgi:hypothetical protein